MAKFLAMGNALYHVTNSGFMSAVLVRPGGTDESAWNAFADRLCDTLNGTIFLPDEIREKAKGLPDSDDEDADEMPPKRAEKAVPDFNKMPVDKLEKLYAETMADAELIRRALTRHNVKPSLSLSPNNVGKIRFAGMVHAVK